MKSEKLEIWRDIPNYDGYQASNMGRVRSLNRTVVDSMGRELFLKGRVLKGGVHKNGYRQFTLTVNGEGRTFKASQLVAVAFLNHSVNGNTLVVDHINGVKTDDRLSNLRIVTHRKNTSTCFRKDRSSLTSKYVGVSWGEHAKKWQAQIQYEGEVVYLGYYSTEIDASNAYQKALGEINDNSFNPNDYAPKFTSKFKGVYFSKVNNKWVSYVRLSGKQKHVGSFNTEIEAYQALQKFKKDNNKLIDKET